MKKLHFKEIIEKLSDLYININYRIPEKIKNYIKVAYEREKEILSKKYLKIILENIEIAEKEKLPICQDTGMAVVFVEIGPEVKIEMGKYRNIEEIINEAIKIGSENGYLRKSIVTAIERKNTETNTPAVIHYFPREREKFKITVMAKGFGSENVSRIKMLNPYEGKEGIEKFIIQTIKKAGALPCPPVFIGVGIGGTFEKSAILSKFALTKIFEENSEYYEWERKILEKINELKIGAGGFGGRITALDIKILTFPTHIAGLPVAVNISCWAHRTGFFEL